MRACVWKCYQFFCSFLFVEIMNNFFVFFFEFSKFFNSDFFQKKNKKKVQKTKGYWLMCFCLLCWLAWVYIESNHFFCFWSSWLSLLLLLLYPLLLLLLFFLSLAIHPSASCFLLWFDVFFQLKIQSQTPNSSGNRNIQTYGILISSDQWSIFFLKIFFLDFFWQINFYIHYSSILLKGQWKFNGP